MSYSYDHHDAPLVSYGGIDALLTSDIRNGNTYHRFVHTTFTTLTILAKTLSSKSDLQRLSKSYVKYWYYRDTTVVQNICDLVLLVILSHAGVNQIAETCRPC